MSTIEIGWQDSNCPIDTPITPKQLIRSDALTKARQHLAIERGAKYAWQAAWKMARQLKRIAASLPGGTLQLHTTNQTSAPRPYDAYYGLGIEVRYVIQHRIQWDISLYSAPSCSRRGSYVWGIAASNGAERNTFRSASRMDQLLRNIDREARPAFQSECERLAEVFAL